jgi:hypothetical protein
MLMELDPSLIDANFVLRRFAVKASAMVFVRGIFEASDGVGIPFSTTGGELTVATFAPRARELDELLEDLRVDLGDAWLWGPDAVEPAHEARIGETA